MALISLLSPSFHRPRLSHIHTSSLRIFVAYIKKPPYRRVCVCKPFDDSNDWDGGLTRTEGQARVASSHVSMGWGERTRVVEGVRGGDGVRGACVCLELVSCWESVEGAGGLAVTG